MTNTYLHSQQVYKLYGHTLGNKIFNISNVLLITIFMLYLKHKLAKIMKDTVVPL